MKGHEMQPLGEPHEVGAIRCLGHRAREGFEPRRSWVQSLCCRPVESFSSLPVLIELVVCGNLRAGDDGRAVQEEGDRADRHIAVLLPCRKKPIQPWKATLHQLKKEYGERGSTFTGCCLHCFSHSSLRRELPDGNKRCVGTPGVDEGSAYLWVGG